MQDHLDVLLMQQLSSQCRALASRILLAAPASAAFFCIAARILACTFSLYMRSITWTKCLFC